MHNNMVHSITCYGLKTFKCKNQFKQYRTIGITGNNNRFYQNSPVIIPARIYSVCAVFLFI